MKVDFFLAFFLVFFVVDNVNSGAIDPSLKLVTLEDLAEGEEINFEEFEKEYERSKRSGLGSTEALLGSLKFILAQGAKAKLGLLGKASAGVASSVASASGSKALAYGYPSYLPPGKGDPWSMKKAVLNTLFQAVKAIKGGVLAIKGQLLKGGGYLLAGGGKLVTAKGEVITNLGKKLAKSAFGGSHPDYSSEVHEVGSYGHFQPSGYEYGAPAVHGPDHFQPGFPGYVWNYEHSDPYF